MGEMRKKSPCEAKDLSGGRGQTLALTLVIEETFAAPAVSQEVGCPSGSLEWKTLSLGFYWPRILVPSEDHSQRFLSRFGSIPLLVLQIYLFEVYLFYILTFASPASSLSTPLPFAQRGSELPAKQGLSSCPKTKPLPLYLGWAIGSQDPAKARWTVPAPVAKSTTHRPSCTAVTRTQRTYVSPM